MACTVTPVATVTPCWASVSCKVAASSVSTLARTWSSVSMTVTVQPAVGKRVGQLKADAVVDREHVVRSPQMLKFG